MSARILIYDIETSPIISYNWGIWEQNAIEVIEDWQILSVAWTWLGEKKIHCVAQCDFKGYKPGVNNDKNVVKQMWELFDEADLVVAHNGDSFDQKKSQARMMVHGLQPPSPYRQTDTKKLAKQNGAFTSNKLADLAKSLNVSRKGDSGGFQTWKDCLEGKVAGWRKLKNYNKQDIPPLRDLYLKLRPWDKRAFPINVLESRPDACPKCGGTRVNKVMKYRATNTNLYQYYRCVDCGGMAKSRVPEYKQATEKMQFTN